MFCEFEEDVLGQRSIYIKKTGNSDLQIDFFSSVNLFVVEKVLKLSFQPVFSHHTVCVCLWLVFIFISLAGTQ